MPRHTEQVTGNEVMKTKIVFNGMLNGEFHYKIMNRHNGLPYVIGFIGYDKKWFVWEFHGNNETLFDTVDQAFDMAERLTVRIGR